MVMRKGTWDKQLPGPHGRNRSQARLKGGRKARPQWVDLENLESRTLLATIPAATATGAPMNLSGLVGNAGAGSQTSSEVAVDPDDPSKLVTVWVDNDPTMLGETDGEIGVIVEAAYSINSGQSWLPMLVEPTTTLSLATPGVSVSPELFDPTTSGPTHPYIDQTTPTLGFDDSGNFYILSEFESSGGGSGAVALQKYNFNGSFPTSVALSSNQQTSQPYLGAPDDLKVIYQWDSGSDDEAIDPTMAVDDSQTSEPTGVTTQTDAFSGNVYVSWATVDVNTAIPIPDFNPNRIVVEASSDGGNDFTPMTIADQGDGVPLDDSSGPTSERDGAPALTVAQGRSGSENGQANDLGIPGGQVAATWDDFGDSKLFANTISAGQDFSFSDQFDTGGFIGEEIPEGTATELPLTVSINKTAGLDTLDVTVNIVDSSDQFLGLTLIAPNGDSFELLANQVPFIGATADTGQGIGGGNLGVITYTDNNIPFYAMGTTFDDNAVRDIFDSTAAGTNGLSGPAIGEFQPEFGSLDSFLAEELAKGDINGSWKLELNDTNTPPTTPPTSPNFIINWSLSFGKGVVADNDVLIPNVNDSTDLLVTPINSYAAAGVTSAGTVLGTVSVPSSPVDIGTDVVMAEDNTLGQYSPYEGRIYMAYVGYYNVIVDGVKNPTTNTDIFLTFSDDGGRTWSDPTQVNDDSADTDGFSTANDQNFADEFDGESQYQPEIAVDPTTGTVVLSWRDARNDPADVLVATYIATSIDGGNTFSAQSYTNPQSTAVDAISGQTDVLGPESDNATALAVNETYGYGSSMGLAVYAGQVYPIWAGNFDGATDVNDALVGDSLSIFYRPMVIAAGPRIVASTQGAITYAEASSGTVSFTVSFDRPLDPQFGVTGVTPGSPTWSFYAADVQVFYQDTTLGDPSVQFLVLNVVPVLASGVGPDNKFGFTEFTVTFSTAAVPLGNYTGTYSYLVSPDDENGNPIEEPVASFILGFTPDTKQLGPFSSGTINLPIPITTGGGGSGTNDDFTISTIDVTGFNNQIVTALTVNLTMTASVADELDITLTAPDGVTETVPVIATNGNGSVTLSNTPFALTGYAGGLVDGDYTLSIEDDGVNDRGTLTSWSVTLNAESPGAVLQLGDQDDQNADGTPDENPLTLPNGYTGLTPGDVYAVPTPQLTAPLTFTTAQSILTPPFDSNTLPLIVPGPQIISTEAVATTGQTSSGGYGSSDELVDDTTSQFNVTFDRPVQVSSFPASQVLSIMGPLGSISAPQSYAASSVDQEIAAATSAGPGTLTSDLTIDTGGTLTIQDLTVSLSIASASDSSLSVDLVSPEGTVIQLFSGVGGASGQNFANTVLDDSATTSITAGTAPFTGTFIPEEIGAATLASLQGKGADGLWQLKITNKATGVASTLDTWSLNITPTITVSALNPTTTMVNGVSETVATEFGIFFPQQQGSGTYTIQLGPDIEDEFDDGMDVTASAGLDVLRDYDQTGPTATMQYTAGDLPMTIPTGSSSTQSGSSSTTPGTVSSSIVVPDNFDIAGDTTAAGLSVMQVRLDLSYADDPNLTATLYHYSTTGTLMGEAILFSGVGSGPNEANFDQTVFDDNAATPVEQGSAPFSATYNPQESLATVFAPTANGQQGMTVQGTWTLVISNASAGGTTGTFNGWSLTFQKPLPTSGLGVSGSDNATVSFQLFTLATSDTLSSQEWTSVGEASTTDEAGQVNAIAVDPSDPSGNTVYVGGASGGIWKTTDFLTTNPAGPTWIPLTNFGPTAAVNIASITIFPRNDNPDDSIIIAATGGANSGQYGSNAPGVGFLISTNGGNTWNLYDSTDNVSAVSEKIDDTSNLLPIDSTARNREFVGTTAYQVTVDPELTPSGQVIIYAALSGTNGGIWMSQNTGQTWTQVIAGNATSVVLDPNSGLPLDPISGSSPSNPSEPGSPTTVGNLQIAYAGMTSGPQGSGVYMSTNQGQSWALMAGGIGDPQIFDATNDDKNVGASTDSPNGAGGRIVLATPAAMASQNYAESEIYSGWLYAAVATTSGGFDGLFITKDFGDTWTKIQLNSLPPVDNYNEAVPTNITSDPQYPITDDAEGNVDFALTVDPADPNITYLGGFGGNGYNSDTGLIRVNATDLDDDHALESSLDQNPNFGFTLMTGGGTTYDNIDFGDPIWVDPQPESLDPTSFLNFIRNPDDPFLEDSTLFVENYSTFNNSGAGATWTPMDVPVTGAFVPSGSFQGTLTDGSSVITGMSTTSGLVLGYPIFGTGIQSGSFIESIDSATSITISAPATTTGTEYINPEISGTGYQIAVAEIDPTTGLPRLIVGSLTGIYSGLDDNGTFETATGDSNALPSINRNGDLDLAQTYYGAVQPSTAAAQIAGALFYSGNQNIGGQASDPDILSNGDLQWSALGDDFDDPLGPSIDTFTPSDEFDLSGGSFLIASGTAVDEQGTGTLFQYWSPGQGGNDTGFVEVNGIGRTFGLIQASGGDPTPDPQWSLPGDTGSPTSWANIVVNPVDSDDDLISSTTGNIFETTNQGETWFDIGTPTTFGLASGGDTPSFALAFGAPDPTAPSGIGNLGNFVYVGTETGKIYVSQNAGGSWTSISNGLDGSTVNEIITDPARGSHDAYAVTDEGVYYLADSIVSATNPTPTWVNITGDLKTLAYTIFGQSYDPATDPNSKAYDLATIINSIAANWNYTIPNNPTDLADGYHPVLYVGANSGVYMSTDNGTTWSLYPSTTFGAVSSGGNLPHVDVTDLSLSQGNVAVATGMPDLAGPYNPEDPNATADPDLLMASTYGEGSFAIDLAPMLFNTSTDPVQVAASDTSGTAADGTTLVTTALPTIDGTSEISGFGGATWVTIVDETPGDPDYGQVIGGFNPADVTAKTTSITANSSNSTDAFGNFAIPVTAAFGSNGLKTIEVYTTDDAGAKSNPVTITFTLQATNIVVPPATTPPGAPTIAFASTVNSIGGVPVTSLTDLGFTGTTVTGTYVTVTETWTDPPSGYTGATTITQTIPASDIASDGSFNFVFQDFTEAGSPVLSGTFTVSATATYTSDPNHVGPSATSNIITFEIDDTQPAPVTDFRLNPVDETEVPGTDVTSDRTPYFIGTVVASDPVGYTVELFVAGDSAVWSTATVGATQTDANGKTYNFLIQLPYSLNNGETSVYVEVVDPAGNVSNASNSVGVVINSIEADYNGGTTSDPAVFDRDTANNQLQVTVQTPTGSAPPWFGPSGTPFTPSNVFTGILTSGSTLVTGLSTLDGLVAGQNITGTGIPAGATILAVNSTTSTLTLSAKATASGTSTLTSTDPADDEVPFEGDFDGDGLTDLAFYNLSTGTWTIDESSNYAIQGPQTFTMGTPNSSIPVVGYFSPNGGQLTQAPQVAQAEEVAVMTYKNGQDIWTIDSTTEGDYTVTMSGQAGDIPVPGDYDSVGYDQLAVYRPATSSTPAEFIVLQQNYSSSTGTVTYSTQTINIGQYLAQFGLAADATQLVPVPDQYNNVAPASPSTTPIFGTTEAAVYDPVKGVYLILGPSGAYTVSGFQPGDIPAPADYLGNGSDQAVVYRPSTGQFIEGTEAGTLTTIATVSQTNDIPLAAPLSYRMPTDPPSGGDTSGTGSGSTGGTGSSTTGGTGSSTTGGTGSGSTGGTGSSSSGGTSSVATGGTGSSSSGGSSSSSSGQSGQAAAAPPVSVPSSSKHAKKVVTKKAHPKKPVKKVKAHTKKETAHATKKVHVTPKVKHKAAVAKPAVVTTGHTHVVDLALEDIHVNLRSTRKHHLV
jgi:subtilisin-like proprotein convertase family protein